MYDQWFSKGTTWAFTNLVVMKITGLLIALLFAGVLSAQQLPQLLIVTTDDFQQTAQAIRANKLAEGISTKLLYTSAISAFPGSEDIQEAIRIRHRTFPFDHILLLGDAQHIPPFSGISGTWHDHGYSLADDNDLLPDFAVGRLAFTNDEAALDWWEQQQAARQTGYHGGSAIVSVSALHFDDRQGQQISDTLIDRGLTVQQHRQVNQTNDGAAILQALKSGVGWAIYYGHGDAVGWNSLQPGISIASLTKESLSLPTMVLSAACDNANFVQPNGPSLGEQFLAAGAMGFIGCTGQCLYDYSDTVTKYTLFRYLEKPYRTIGEALQLAKYDMYAAFNPKSPNFTTLTLQHFILLGDPTARPPINQMMAPDFYQTDQSICMASSALFWRWQRDDRLLTSGYHEAGSDCQTIAAAANTLSLSGRHIIPTLVPFSPSDGHVYPNPLQAGTALNVLGIEMTEAQWISTDGKLLPAVQTGEGWQAPQQAGIWYLQGYGIYGVAITFMVIVLP